MNDIQRIYGVLLLLLFTSQPVVAQGGCPPDKVENLVAVQFVSGKQKVPQYFTLKNTGSPSLRIPVSDRGDGYWTCESCPALVGREHVLKPDFDIPGYSIAPVQGINRMLGGGCYAVFTFKVNKVAWALEVIPNPPIFPFRYQKNGGAYQLRSPGAADWQVIRGLALDDKINLKIYEIYQNKAIYLFSLPVSQTKIPSLTEDDIAGRILQERTNYWIGSGPKDDLDPNDPYLQTAKEYQVGSNPISGNLAKILIKAALKGLELKDKMEDLQ